MHIKHKLRALPAKIYDYDLLECVYFMHFRFQFADLERKKNFLFPTHEIHE